MSSKSSTKALSAREASRKLLSAWQNHRHESDAKRDGSSDAQPGSAKQHR